MRVVLLATIAFAFGLCLAIYGALLTFRADLFIWFHNTFVDRDPSPQNVSWKKQIHQIEYKVFGIVLVAVGLLIAYNMIAKLITRATN